MAVTSGATRRAPHNVLVAGMFSESFQKRLIEEVREDLVRAGSGGRPGVGGTRAWTLRGAIAFTDLLTTAWIEFFHEMLWMRPVLLQQVEVRYFPPTTEFSKLSFETGEKRLVLELGQTLLLLREPSFQPTPFPSGSALWVETPAARMKFQGFDGENNQNLLLPTGGSLIVELERGKTAS
jgi:hypothetical protein